MSLSAYSAASFCDGLAIVAISRGSFFVRAEIGTRNCRIGHVDRNFKLLSDSLETDAHVDAIRLLKMLEHASETEVVLGLDLVSVVIVFDRFGG